MTTKPAGYIAVEVVYARLAAQRTLGPFACCLRLPSGASLRDAVTASGVLGQHAELDPAALSLGVFGRPRPAEALLVDGDRVEIYLALSADAKERRRAKSKAKGRWG